MKRLLLALVSLVFVVGSAAAQDLVSPIHSTVNITPTVTVDTSAYTANDVVGGAIELTNASRPNIYGGRVVGLKIIDNEVNGATFKAYFYNDSVTAADQAAYNPSDADQAKIAPCEFVVNRAITTTNTIVLLPDDDIVSCPFVTTGSNSLYLVLVTQGTPTYTAGTAIDVEVTISHD